jgi:hypothetical protein
VKQLALNFSQELQGDITHIVEKNVSEIERTQLYIGKPMLYYGAELNGLFSAQVVPNDEQVSKEFGKKIFAYADFVMESKRAKPIMQLSVETFGLEFVQKQRDLIEQNPTLWQRIYDITTIGHEFGHILWVDEDTESIMNGSGEFKNIEEFKATLGGLMAFFEMEDRTLIEHIIDDLVSRAVGLMAWREVGEVLPYYCEGLIHLDILFSSKLLNSDDGKVEIDYGAYENMKQLYRESYKTLAQTYIDKLDANTFLSKYAQKVNGVYLPNRKDVREFVESYYKRYQEIGQRVYSFD